MSPSNRYTSWVVLMVIGMTCSAPLDEQRIYFPGENPGGDLVSRSYGLQPIQIQPTHQQHGQDGGRGVAWSQESPEILPEQAEPPAYGRLHSSDRGFSIPVQGAVQYQPGGPSQGAVQYELGGPSQGAVQYQPGGPVQYQPGGPVQYQPGGPVQYQLDGPSQGAVQYQAVAYAADPEHAEVGQKILPETPSYGSSGASSYQSQGAGNYLVHHPVQGAMYPNLTPTGVVHGGKKTTKHTWTSHFSSTGTGQIHHNPQQMTGQVEAGLEHIQLGPTLGSSVHESNSKELAAILDRESSQSHELHPNIKQAYQNVIRGYESEKPAHHTVHKVSHIKKTTVQNVGKEPVHIQSTSSNDDINLSQLIEQLQMLEQSPRHVNITWCEEKIREFLKELRRKQAGGVFINQQVQEQTLHQILTHESVESMESSGGVHEPLFTKVTVKPLGGEHLTQAQVTSEIIKHEHEMKEEDEKIPEVSSSAPKEEVLTHELTEILTVIPQEVSSPPEVMSHHHEQSKEVPPFTSDHDDLKDLELELPEFVPFEHAHSGSVDAFEGSVQKQTRPMPHPEAAPTQAHSEVSSSVYHHAEQETGHSSSSEGMTEEQNAISPNRDLPQHSENEHSQIVEESQHIVHGRPSAPQTEISNAQESNREEASFHTANGEKSTEESLLLADGSHKILVNVSQDTHHIHGFHKQQIDYDTLIEELIQLESIPGHQAIDKCEEKIQEFLEILKYQQEQGFGRNQQELERLHKTLIEQAQERSQQIANGEETTLPPTSFWRRVQKKVKSTYESAKDRAKEVMG